MSNKQSTIKSKIQTIRNQKRTKIKSKESKEGQAEWTWPPRIISTGSEPPTPGPAPRPRFEREQICVRESFLSLDGYLALEKAPPPWDDQRALSILPARPRAQH